MKNQTSKNFHVPLNSLSSVKTAVLTAKGPYGVGRLGVPGVGTRDPRHGLGVSINRENFLQEPGPNTHTAATIRKEVLTPLPP